MSSGSGSRVPIPSNVMKTIQDIREITCKQHSDDEIYAVLKDCSMDPNETAQKLLYLDTFHEVRRRRDRKKEGLNTRASEDSRSKQGVQGRGGRGASGGYSSNVPDGGGGSSPAIRKENGVNPIAESVNTPSIQPVLPKTRNNAASQVTRVSAVAPNVPANQSNESSGHDSAGQPSAAIHGENGVNSTPSTQLILQKTKNNAQHQVRRMEKAMAPTGKVWLSKIRSAVDDTNNQEYSQSQAPTCKENGVNRMPSIQPVSQKTKTDTQYQVLRASAVAPSGPAKQSNKSYGHGSAGQSIKSVARSNSADGDTSKQEDAVAKASSPTPTFGTVARVDQGKSFSSSQQCQTPDPSASVADVYSSSSDPILAPSISQNSGIGGVTSKEVGSQWITDDRNHIKGSKVVPHEVGDLLASESEKSVFLNSSSKQKIPSKSNEVEKNRLLETGGSSSSSSYNVSMIIGSSSSSSSQPLPLPEISSSEVCTQPPAELRQHVTFLNHFQVPDALKAGLTFGNFDSNFGLRERSSIETGGGNNTSAALESSLCSDETATSSDQSPSSAAPVDHADYPHSPSHLIKRTSVSDSNALSGVDSKTDQPKQEALLDPEGPPTPTVQNAQNSGLNFMSTVLGTQQIQFEGAAPQTQEISQLPNFANANSQALSSSSFNPPPQNPIPVSPQSVSLFRPPYPANFFPYGHYYPPIYVSPIHQFLSPSGFPQQPSPGNMYLPGAAAGIKFPLPQFKAGANTGKMTHIGIPSGSFITPPVGYAPSPTVNAGSSTGTEDLAVSHLKENHIYTTGQLSEGSGVWMSAPGQDLSSLQINSLFNFAPQGQQLAFPPTQVGHGAFAGIYQPGQTVASPSTLLQQSQAVAGTAETVGPHPGTFPLPQHAQMNWNSNF
ncbi:hypothetical protein L6164_029534 [Bauhinia variegata]|uniref:Uncharacterized protein n=1 Tax=Bauhinia variegata TaxID=167791 RepID=A0ACB9L9F5_BAUVA|nr:hypothetical protein L6164_029534 [Bauhinia variegata]